jgi:hypothetical protein
MTSKTILGFIGVVFVIGAIMTTGVVNAKPPADNPGKPFQEISDKLDMLKDDVAMIKDDVAMIKDDVTSLQDTTEHKGTSWLNFDLSVLDGQNEIFHIAFCGFDGVCTGYVNGRLITDDPGATFILKCNLLDGQGTSSSITLATFTGSNDHNFSQEFACPWALRIDVLDGPNPGGTITSAYLGAGYVSTKSVTYNAEP